MRNPSTLGVAIAMAIGSVSAQAGETVNGPMAFNPIPSSAYELTDSWGDNPFLIPDGYHQYKVTDERDLNIYEIYPGGVDVGSDYPDLTDMNTVNETGKQAGRFLYRTHEVDNCGAMSVHDLKTGETKTIAQASNCSPDAPAIGPQFPDFTRGGDLDGIRWTPWGTVLFAEEDPQGRLYELVLDKNDPSVAADVKDRPAVGRVRHEGIEIGRAGEVYVIDELKGGSIFKFVPDSHGDLSSGQLYGLKVSGIPDAEQNWNGDAGATGIFEWVALDRTQVQIDGKVAADNVNATEYGRPEDIERIGNTLYVATTSSDRVLAINLDQQIITPFVVDGVNVPDQDLSAVGPVANPPIDQFVTGFDDPDNLAQGPDGRLWIVEDNSPSDIRVAEPDRDGDGMADDVHLFASLRDGAWDCDDSRGGQCFDWDDNGAEATGIYFGKDPKTLFVNIQHAEAELRDGTWAITNRNLPNGEDKNQ